MPDESPKNWKPTTCDGCGQTTTYLQPLDRGTSDIVKSMANAVWREGKNDIEISKRMVVNPSAGHETAESYAAMIAQGLMTPSMRNNISKARAHGLLAKVRESSGHWLLTTKGADFLCGKRIPKYAVMSKAEKKQIGYLDDGTPGCETTVGELKGAYWDIPTFGAKIQNLNLGI